MRFELGLSILINGISNSSQKLCVDAIHNNLEEFWFKGISGIAAKLPYVVYLAVEEWPSGIVARNQILFCSIKRCEVCHDQSTEFRARQFH